jgi:predicted peroxiredoxin
MLLIFYVFRAYLSLLLRGAFKPESHRFQQPLNNHRGGPTMKDNVLVILSCGTDNPNRATRAAFMAMVAHKEGKNVTLFLLDDGVYIAQKGVAENIKAATGDSCDDHLTYLQSQGIPILACTPCAKSRRIGEADLIEGARMGTGVEMIHLACDAAVISL